MVLGFILISTEAGKDREVYDQLANVAQITEMMPLFGEFDLIAKVEAASWDELGQLVIGRIRPVPGVTDTRLLTGAKV